MVPSVGQTDRGRGLRRGTGVSSRVSEEAGDVGVGPRQNSLRRWCLLRTMCNGPLFLRRTFDFGWRLRSILTFDRLLSSDGPLFPLRSSPFTTSTRWCLPFYFLGSVNTFHGLSFVYPSFLTE